MLLAALICSFGHNCVCCLCLCPCHSSCTWERLPLFPNINPNPLSSVSGAHSRALASSLSGFGEEVLMDSMWCLPGEVPSILHCNYINLIKQECNLKFWYLCGESSPSTSLFTPVAIWTLSLYKMVIYLDTHKRPLVLLAFYLQVGKKSSGAVSTSSR